MNRGVSWNRLLIGRWLDPQVGSHVLIGAAVGSGLWTVIGIIDIFQVPANTLDSGFSLQATEGTRQWIGVTASVLVGALFVGLIAFFTIFGLRALFKKDWAAAVAASFLFTLAQPNIWESAMLVVKPAIYVVLFGALTFVLLRFGLVATISAVFFINSHQFLTVGQDWSSWIAPSGSGDVGVSAGVAALAFWRSLGTRELIGAEDGPLH